MVSVVVSEMVHNQILMTHTMFVRRKKRGKGGVPGEESRCIRGRRVESATIKRRKRRIGDEIEGEEAH